MAESSGLVADTAILYKGANEPSSRASLLMWISYRKRETGGFEIPVSEPNLISKRPNWPFECRLVQQPDRR